jgi:hypothetical protein
MGTDLTHHADSVRCEGANLWKNDQVSVTVNIQLSKCLLESLQRRNSVDEWDIRSSHNASNVRHFGRVNDRCFVCWYHAWHIRQTPEQFIPCLAATPFVTK